jgi:hypothetical protein
MQPLKLDEAIRPLSEFRAGVVSFVKQVNETGRPLVLTHHGIPHAEAKAPILNASADAVDLNRTA